MGIALAAWLAFSASAEAQPLFGVPLHDTAPRVHQGEITVAAVGHTGASRRLDAGRLSARRAAEVRARAMLHRFLDDALAAARAQPAAAAEAHAALDRGARVTAVRWLTDGAVVVVVSCPRQALGSFALRFAGE